MPAPKMPVAKPRRAGSNQALTNGMPTANVVPAMPRKKAETSSNGKDSWLPANTTRRTGGTDAKQSRVNIRRPP